MIIIKVIPKTRGCFLSAFALQRMIENMLKQNGFNAHSVDAENVTPRTDADVQMRFKEGYQVEVLE